MKQFVSVLLVLSLLLQSAPLVLAGNPNQIIFLDKGAGGPVVIPKIGQNGVLTGQHGQTGYIFINPGQWNDGKGGNPDQWNTNPGQYTVNGLPVGQTNDQRKCTIIQCSPSGFPNYGPNCAINSLREYKKQQRRIKRGQCVVVNCCPPYQGQGQQYSPEEYELLRLYAQQKHEREMLRMRYSYEQKERARQEAMMAKERQRQTNMMLFQGLLFTIPMTFAAIQANKDARRSRDRFNRYNQDFYRQY